MEWIIILLMLAVNAVFAAYEMALASVSRVRLEVLVNANRRGARSAAYMKDRLEASLAVIQLGITLAGAIAAATGGAGIDQWLSPKLEAIPGVSAGLAGFLSLLLFVIPLSAATIIFAELVPKMIGINNKEAVVLALSPAMNIVARIFRPVIVIFEAVVKHLVRAGQGGFKGQSAQDDRTGLLELRAATALARATRIIGPMEERIVMSAVQLSARTVAEAMVPAKDISTIPAGASMMDALIEAHMHMHTRYPVCKVAGDSQTIDGYVTFKDIVTALKVDPSGSGLSGIIRPISRIASKTTLAKALTDMIRDRVHIALVMDDSTVLGLLTMEDIVEELVGDIRDEYDHLPAHMHPIGDGWLVGGGVTIESLRNVLGDSIFQGVEPQLAFADWVDRVRNSSARCGDSIRTDGIDVLVRKVRRNRTAEAVVRKIDSGIKPG
ncbi:MAG: HlyC/CorC family transporter [Verrucomicrobia bacterium]|nr:HlyC/CorC family transporter [Verrucomicrobiota bacterium]